MKKTVGGMLVCAAALAVAAHAQETAPGAAPDQARATAIRESLAVIEKQLAAHGGSWEKWAEDLKPYREDIRGVTGLKWPWPAKDGYVFQGAAHALHMRDSFDDLPDGERPLEGLVHFSRQLKALGIDLIVAIIPAKMTIHPDYLYAAVEGPQRPARAPADGVVSLALAKLMYDLLRNDVEVVNLHEAFREFRQKNGDAVPLFYVRDGHYLNRGAQLAAEKIAERLKRYDFVQKALAAENPFVGEKGARTDGDKADDSLLLIKDRSGQSYPKGQGNSPVFTLGDSHLGYNAGTAPFSGQIAYRIGLFVAEQWKEGLAAGIPVEVARDPFLKERRVVVLHYSERMIRPRNGEPKWPIVNLPGVDQAKVATAPLVTSGTVKPAAAPPAAAPVPNAAPVPGVTPAPAVAAPAPVPAAAATPPTLGADYMGNVPGRPVVWIVGGDMVAREFGWAHYVAALQPAWRVWKVAARDWRVDAALADFEKTVAPLPAPDAVILGFGDSECAQVWAKDRKPEEFGQLLGQLAARVRGHEKAKNAPLVFVTPFPVRAAWLDARTAPTYGAAAADARSQAMAEAVRRAGVETKALVVDLHKWALDHAGERPVADLKKVGFLQPTGYGTAPDGGALCGRHVVTALTGAGVVKGRGPETARLAQAEAQFEELDGLLAQTCAGTVRAGAELEPIPVEQKYVVHFLDEARVKVPVEALAARRWLTFLLRGQDEGYISVCVARTDTPYETKLELTYEGGEQESLRLPGYGTWGAIAEETPDQTVNWEVTGLNFGKNRLRPASGGPAGQRHWTLMTFDLAAVGGRKVTDARLYFRYGNTNQRIGPDGKGVTVSLVGGRDAWVAHGAATWRTRDGVRPWTGGKVDAAARGAKLDEFLKKDLLPEVREAALAEKTALAGGPAGRVPRPAPQLPAAADVAAPHAAGPQAAAPAAAEKPLRRLFIAPDAPARIRRLAQAPGSHHQQVLAAIKARVASPNPESVYGTGYGQGFRAVETAFLSALAETEAESRALAATACDVMKRWTDTGSGTLGKSTEARCLAFTFNWAYPAWTPLQRREMRERAESVLAALGALQHGNLGGDRTSNFMGVIRGGELLLWLCTGADVKSERCRFLIGELKTYFDNTFGDLGVGLEGPGYTEYPATFAHAAALAAEECGDATLRDAIANHAFWKMLLYTRTSGLKTSVGVPWGVSAGADLTDGWSSQLLRLSPTDALPHYLWWYDRTTGTRTPTNMVNRFDSERHGMVWSLLYYPTDVAAKNPAGALLPAVADSSGYIFFRNHWEDAGTIIASLIAQARKAGRGWNQPEQLAISLLAHGEPLIVGPVKDTKPASYSSLLVDGKYTYENATATMGKVVAFEPGKSGGYAIVQGGEMYTKLGVKEAVRHMKVDFLPGDTALVATLDRVKSAAGEHAYTWQANVGEGIKVESGEEGGRRFFLMKGAKAFVKGWVLHPATAAVTAGDPLGVTVKGVDADIWIALYVGAGEPPQGVVSGTGLDSVLTVAGRKARFDAAAGRMVVE